MATLVMLDFSGTLSIETVRFGQPENLECALLDSGLWALGVDSLKIFWEEIVSPTWERGSTTQIGYVQLLIDAVTRLDRGTHSADLSAVTKSA